MVTRAPVPAWRAGGGRLVLVLAGVYGVALALAGILPAGGFGGTTAAAALPDALPGRPVGPAPVVPANPGIPFATSGGGPPVSAVPSAAVGRDVPGERHVFAPTRVVLPDRTTAPVVPVGLHADGALVIPDDVHTVVWWTGGS